MVNNKLNLETEQVLIGSLLGDGCLQLPKNGINAFFRESHSTKQREYLKWKKIYLNDLNPKFMETSTFDKRTKKYYHHAILWTSVNPILTKYFKLMYPNNKKTITKSILKKVDVLALAVWYCDDGSFGYINQNGKIATYLPYEQNMLITEILKEKFDLNCTVNKDGKSYHIYFNVKEIRKFLDLIKDYVPKCMSYKLGPFSKDNLERLKEENLKRRVKDKLRHKRDMEDPIKREKIRKQKAENQRTRFQNPEYRKKQNEYQRIWWKNYRIKNRKKYNEYHRIRQKENYWKKKK